MERYLTACGGDTRKAMTLYRYNLQISQEMLTIVSCFEVALRNAIDRKLTDNLGDDWLRDSKFTISNTAANTPKNNCLPPRRKCLTTKNTEKTDKGLRGSRIFCNFACNNKQEPKLNLLTICRLLQTE